MMYYWTLRQKIDEFGCMEKSHIIMTFMLYDEACILS